MTTASDSEPPGNTGTVLAGARHVAAHNESGTEQGLTVTRTVCPGGVTTKHVTSPEPARRPQRTPRPEP